MKEYKKPTIYLGLSSEEDIICTSIDGEQNYNDTTVEDNFND